MWGGVCGWAGAAAERWPQGLAVRGVRRGASSRLATGSSGAGVGWERQLNPVSRGLTVRV
eukprot:362828-Chlamydomonas_euryale.AAC.4